MLLGDEVDVEAGFEEKSVAVNEAEDDELGDDSLLDRVIQLKNPTVNTNFFITKLALNKPLIKKCMVIPMLKNTAILGRE